jgi:Dihydroprymidine dehydrogenase domain II, 4Fe-4S cluster
MINRRQRLKIEAVKPPKQDAQQRIYNFNEVSQPYNAGNGHGASPALPVLRHAPCSKGCPLHNDIPAALFLLGRGDFIGAAFKFMETYKFPDVCGRICPQERQCEGSCVMAKHVALSRWPAPVGHSQLQAEQRDRICQNRPFRGDGNPVRLQLPSRKRASGRRFLSPWLGLGLPGLRRGEGRRDEGARRGHPEEHLSGNGIPGMGKSAT